ncbi:hypothetical protein D3C73_1401750 [compost metagenome]
MACNEAFLVPAFVKFHADGTNFHITDPYPGILWFTRPFYTETGNIIDNDLLQLAQVTVQIQFTSGPQPKQGITDKLAGAMVCNISAAVDFKHRNAPILQLLCAE